ncbi:hypothetical protein IW261DRAFT_1427508 [Armillaria novae-zelandiae]|uniref:Uncharacterized protein n=1 Tax=Armillaria novae-zelandiae TaxID=153914 RepID=A0AA39TUP4_9AGAR|nr:hypothetical protein IW261DRAFT_1427508 [Armillaria novae-zelandiae]
MTKLQDRLMEDLSRGQKTMLMEEHNQYIAVIPFGAGPKFYQSYTMLKQDVLAFLDGFQIEKGDYRISLPSEHLAKKVHDYQMLWPFFIKGAAPPFQNFLLWQQTFPIDEKLVLNFIPININHQSWVIATYRCGAVENDPARTAKALQKNQKGSLSLTITVGIDDLKANRKARLECVWCKSEMHQSRACPFLDVVQGWCGPSRESMSEKLKETNAESRDNTGKSRVGYH